MTQIMNLNKNHPLQHLFLIFKNMLKEITMNTNYEKELVNLYIYIFLKSYKIGK